MNNEIRTIATLATLALAGGGLTIRSIANRRAEIQKQKQLQQAHDLFKDTMLNVTAIRTAERNMQRAIANGEVFFASVEEAEAAFNAEVAFQKIAVREA